MKLEGGCYCGALRYEAEGEPMMKAQCHCRECQYITGGSPNVFVLMPIGGFQKTKRGPQQFTPSGLERPMKRGFCAQVGTHVPPRPPGSPPVAPEVGPLDEPPPVGRPPIADDPALL